MFATRVNLISRNCIIPRVRHLHSTKPTWDRKPENPLKRTFRILGNDLKSLGDFILQKDRDFERRMMETNFPQFSDVLVIGGGAIGSSIAFWLNYRTDGAMKVVVVEKDPTYEKASTVLSVGGLRQQFSVPENIEMSLYGAEFLRNIKLYLGPESDVYFTPHGYLLLASEAGAQQMKDNVKLQQELGAKNEILSKNQLKERYPWMDVTDVELGCVGLQNEGWFDPWALLCLLKQKALEYGTFYVHGEVTAFSMKRNTDFVMQGTNPATYEMPKSLTVKMANGEERTIDFGLCVIAAGADSGHVAELVKIGTGDGIRQFPLPVEKRKRYVYVFDCNENCPGINTPLTIDHSGVYFRRNGLGNTFIGGRAPKPDEEPSTENLDVDHQFFDEKVWPTLAKRVPAFNSIKVKSAWSGYYDFNTFDENGIVGPHPYYTNIYLATGFSGHGIQQAPAVGRAMAEMILDGEFRTIDLTRLGFDRILLNMPIREANCF